MKGWNLEVSRHLFTRRLNAHSQTDWAIEDQTKNLKSTACPYDEWAFSPLDFTEVRLSYLALAIYMLGVVISMLWHSQVIFESTGDKLSASAECSISKPEVSKHLFASRLNANSQTEWAVDDEAKNLNSTTRPYDEWAFSTLDFTAVWFLTWRWRYPCALLLISMLWRMQVIFESKWDKLSSSTECIFDPGKLKTPIHQQTECPLTNWLSYWGSN